MPRTFFSGSNSETSLRSWGGGGLRVDVVIADGTTLAVPISESTTFATLQNDVLKRAAKLNIGVPGGNLAFRLDTKDGSLAFPTDTVTEVLDLSTRPLIYLCSLPSEERLQVDEVFIRWVTSARALDFPTLAAVPTDPKCVSRQTTIATLKSMAIDRIYKSQASTEAPLLPGFTVELFLMPCALRTTDDKDTTLAELGCSGSSSNPLNIFVVPMKTAFSDEDKPQDLWAFECSDRGIATFLTCLKVLLNQCRHTESANRRMLKTLFKTTHFPPAMEALHALKEDNRLIPYQVAILATCFRDMALRMVPSALIGNSFKCALQGSRQIFAWLEAENMTSSNEVDDPEAALVRTVGLEECSGTSVRGMSYQAGKRKEIVVLQGSGVASASSSSTDVRQVRSVTVTVHMTCQEDLRLLALALWGFYDEIENFYVDFRGNIDDPLKHRRTPGITNRQFFHLLKTANESNNYRLIAPKNLDETYGPAITLSADGYVSEFGTAYGEFKDQKKHTWNAISGTEILESEPGNNILEALKPIMKQRVQEGTWDVDDWNNTQLDAAESSIDTPQEAIVICFDLSYSMNDPLGDDWVGAPNDFTKLTETKQVFENVIGRMLGYQLVSNVVGVVTFSSSEKIKVTRKLSRINQQEFKDMVQDIRGRGQTALWDAIGKARDMLTAFKTVHANTKLRIIVLTDGINNDSINSPEDICTSLYEAEIVLDSIVIGECSTKDLFKLSKHTGGYAFNPQSRLLLFQTFLLEPFLDISARPDIERIPVDNYEISEPKLPDMRTLFDFPPLRKHQLEDGSFVSLNDAGCFFTSHSSTLVGQRNKGSVLASRIVPYRTPSIVSTSGLSASTLRSNGLQRTMSDMRSTSDRSSHSIGRVYLSEITQMLAVSHEQPYSSMDVYVNETNMSYWKVVMEGPKGTPYEKGTFVLSVSMSPSFPQIPPIVRFLTPILHPNVTKHGRVCHQIFTKGWKSSYHVYTVLRYMNDLLRNPSTNDAVDELATLKFWTDTETANIEIAKYVDHFGKRTRNEWRREILEH